MARKNSRYKKNSQNLIDRITEKFTCAVHMHEKGKMIKGVLASYAHDLCKTELGVPNPDSTHVAEGVNIVVAFL